MLGSPVDLKAVDRDSYIVAGITDHICPWQSCYRPTQLLGGRTRFLLSTSGHIAAMVNPPDNDKARYQVAKKCPEDPQEWLRKRGDRPRVLVAGLRGLAGRALRGARSPRPGSWAAAGWCRSATRPERTSMTVDAVPSRAGRGRPPGSWPGPGPRPATEGRGSPSG